MCKHAAKHANFSLDDLANCKTLFGVIKKEISEERYNKLSTCVMKAKDSESNNRCTKVALNKGEVETFIAKARGQADWRPGVEQDGEGDPLKRYAKAQRKARRQCYTGTIETLENETARRGSTLGDAVRVRRGILQTDDARTIDFLTTDVASVPTIGQKVRLCGAPVFDTEKNLVDVTVDMWEPIATP